MSFEFPTTKRAYQKGLYGLTALAIFIWVYLITQTFDGLGSGIDLDALLEGGGSGQSYLFTQLLTEILMGASLFTAWQTLGDSYTPTKPSPKARLLDKHIAALEPRVSEASKGVQDATQDADALKTQRSTFINEQLQAFALLKAKVNFNQHLFGEDL